MAIEDAVLLWLVGTLTGSMVFFAAVVAPKVFRTLPPDHAGVFLRAFFPAYYAWGFTIALLATLAAMRSGWQLATACALVTVIFAYARQLLMPRINAARDAHLNGDAASEQQFKSLHLVSVACNAAQLLTLFAVAAYLVWHA